MSSLVLESVALQRLQLGDLHIVHSMCSIYPTKALDILDNNHKNDPHAGRF